LGSDVRIVMLDDTGNPTGTIFTTTTDILGGFEVTVNQSGPSELTGTGFYYQENTGRLSGAPIALKAMYDIGASGHQDAYINIVTHMSVKRAEFLISEGTGFGEAIVQSESELRSALGIIHPAGEEAGLGTGMNILGGDTADNQYLLGVSCIIMRAAELESVSSEELDANVQLLINTIAQDLESDGVLDQDLVEQLAEAEKTTLPDQCTENLQSWMMRNAVSADVPNIDNVIDSDDDGVPNSEEENPGMVLVPASTFWMGTDPSINAGISSPYHQVTITNSFYIDRFEVTVGEYRRCVDDGVCSNPNAGVGCNYEMDGHVGYPINCISWQQADDYCDWSGERLPTEAEWELAARGIDGRTYPWGEESATCLLAVIKDSRGYGCGTGGAFSVGSRPDGVSPFGAFDMTGNVWEYVADWFEFGYSNREAVDPAGPESGNNHVVRGGSFGSFCLQDTAVFVRAADDYGYLIDQVNNGIGFRCALTTSDEPPIEPPIEEVLDEPLEGNDELDAGDDTVEEIAEDSADLDDMDADTEEEEVPDAGE
jgi:sulfatase modifying factor 1